MKIADTLQVEDDTLHRTRTFDASGYLEENRLYRDHVKAATSERLPDMVQVASIPTALFAEYMRQRGVKWDDPAREDVLAQFLADSDYAHFRSWQGRL